MSFYFLYKDEADRIHKKRFDDPVSAVRFRRSWCTNYAFLRCNSVKNNMAQNLGVKVDTIAKAEELFDNLFCEAESKCVICTQEEFELMFHVFK